jgi:integrase
MAVHAARKAAFDTASRIAAGEDPQADRVRERRAPKERLKPVTVGDLWNTYVEHALPQRKPGTAAHYTWLWATHVGPALAKTPLAELDRASIRALIRKIGTATPTTANRCLALVKGIMSFAVREDLLAANPAAGLAPLFAETSRERVLRDDELAAFWKALDAAPMDPKVNASVSTCAAIRLALLTAQRAGEVVGMHTREIDAAARTWNMPASRTKQKRPQTVALNARAWDLLCERLGEDPATWGSRYVFPMRGDESRSMDRHTLTRTVTHIRTARGLEHFTPHDLRRTCATLVASERAGIPPHVVSEILGHAPAGPRVTQVYMRHAFDTEKRHAMDVWCALLLDIVGEAPPRPSNVTSLRRLI